MTIRKNLLNAMATSTAKQPSSLLAPQELRLSCSDGTILAAQRWKSPGLASSPDGVPTTGKQDGLILCLHGWLDNCRSFHHLAPALAAAGTHSQVVALDLPGHGMSSHKSLDAPPMVAAEYIYYVSEAIHALKEQQDDADGDEEEKVTLVGHSMGTGISTLYAAAFPEHVQQLILLEGAGFLPRDAKDTALHVRKHVTRRRAHHEGSKAPKVYTTLDAAVKARMHTASRSPGDQSISYEAAKEIVQRMIGPPKNGGEGFQFLHDARYTWPSLLYMTFEQVVAILQSASPIDSCILLAENGWPLGENQEEKVEALLKPSVFKKLSGSHHFHADPETADQVANEVLEFILRDRSESMTPQTAECLEGN